MKKMTFKSRLFGGFVGVAAALFAVSCAQGFDDNETWRSDVTGAQLESPALTEANFSTRVNADGSESVQVSWDVVPGAGGYECYAAIVDDPENPVELVNQTVDGTSFSFGKLDDTKYEVRVRTLGNEKLDNTGAASATVVPYSTLVPAQLIPAGQDIVAFVEANILDQDKEQAFELEAGAAYEINAPLDFGKRLVTFRGDKVNRPTVTFGYDGVIRTSAGLKVKFINFDCESMNSKGVIECSENPDASLDAANFPGYAGAGKAYILQDPILIQECNFRQVQRCLFFTGRCAWGIEDLRVTDCVVQLSNDGTTFGDAAVFCTCGETYAPNGSQSWSGAIRNLTVKNSTLYNLKDNSKNRMVRFWSNQMGRIFDSQYGSATFENCTISKIMNDKEFGNNTPNCNEYTITFNNNICYDVFRLQKFIQSNCTKNVDMTTNTIWGVKNPADDTDKSKYATEEDPQFVGPTDQPWDLSKADGGVNFKATGAISSTIGDPRWK